MAVKTKRKRKKPTLRGALASLNRQLKGPCAPAKFERLQKQRNELVRKITGSGYVSVVSGGLPGLGKRG